MASTVGRDRLDLALRKFGEGKENQKAIISGILGFVINGEQKVEVANRPGYVYVRLRDNMSEVIQAYNPVVSPVYGLPVLVSRDTIDPTRYIIVQRETSRYSNWQSSSTYIARHGNQHSFAPELGGGGDIVWVYDRQIIPLLLSPSGSSGAGSIIINQDIVYRNSMWQVVGGTGTTSLLPAKPTDSQARLLLVGINNEGNPWIVTGSLFSASITGSAAISPYLPSPLTGTVLGAVRLVSGTSRVVWDNIYDLRDFVAGNTTNIIQGGDGGGGGGGGGALAIYEDGAFQVSGTSIDFRDESVFVSGSAAYIERPTWTQHHFEDEFLSGNEGNQAGNMNWRIVTGNFDGQIGEYNHPGIVTLDHNAAQAMYMILSTPAAGGAQNIVDFNDVEYLGAIVRPTTTITGSSCNFRFGLINNLGLTAHEDASSGGGIYWSFYAPVDADYWGSVTRRSSKTRNTTSISYVSGSWVLLEIFRREFDQWDFYINDTYHATHTSNVPSGTSFVGFTFPTTSQENEMDIDWFGFRTRKFTQRWT